jgi:sec-independent protein translocase protein TatB
MFDFSWQELMVIGAVALVVIGPKDLPKALKTAGMLVRRARGMAREFQNSIDDMIREAELDDLRKATSLNLDQTIRKTLDPGEELSKPLLHEPPLALPQSAYSALPKALPRDTTPAPDEPPATVEPVALPPPEPTAEGHLQASAVEEHKPAPAAQDHMPAEPALAGQDVPPAS